MILTEAEIKQIQTDLNNCVYNADNLKKLIHEINVIRANTSDVLDVIGSYKATAPMRGINQDELDSILTFVEDTFRINLDGRKVS